MVSNNKYIVGYASWFSLSGRRCPPSPPLPVSLKRRQIRSNFQSSNATAWHSVLHMVDGLRWQRAQEILEAMNLTGLSSNEFFFLVKLFSEVLDQLALGTSDHHIHAESHIAA